MQCVRQGRTKWAALSRREQGDALAALNSLHLDVLGTAAKAQAAQLAKTWLWQVWPLCTAS